MQKDVSLGGTITAESFLARITRQGRNYSSLVIRLLISAFRGRTVQLVTALTLSFVHLGTQGAGIYAVYWYGKQMESAVPYTVPYLHYELNLKDQPEWLWAVVIFSTVCFIISAAFNYLSRRQILNVAETHFALKVEELALASLRLPDPRAPMASQLFKEHRLGALAMGCRRSAITAIGFANAITAVIGGIGAAFFLFWIDAPLTLFILISVGVAALFLYPLTLRAVQAARDREKAQSNFRSETRRLAEEKSPGQIAQSLESADDLARAFIMRRRVLTELVFAVEIGITIILGLVVYYMASQALAGKEQWAVFVAYIAALRMMLSGVSQPIRVFASVSRFYLQMVRYDLFSKDMQKIDTVAFAKVEPGGLVILGTLRTGEDAVAEAGDRVAVLTNERARDPRYVFIYARLPGSTAPLAAAVFDPADVAGNEPSLVLLPSEQLDKDGDWPAALGPDFLKDKLALIVYSDADQVGAFKEKYLLTLIGGEMRRFALLGTEDADNALKEFTLAALSKSQKTRAAVAEEEDDDEDDL